jgi:eukaryotic-like serine/threonine-protein kinase
MDRQLADIISKCLAVDPEERFSNVQAVLDALDARERQRTRRPLVVLGFAGPLICCWSCPCSGCAAISERPKRPTRR